MQSGSETLLVIDIGNTRTHVAFFRNPEPEGIFHLHTTQLNDETLFSSSITEEIQKHHIHLNQLSGVIVSCVVPEVMPALETHLEKLSIPRLVSVNALCDCGLRFRYDDPLQLGADRVCASVAAYTLYNGPVIALDAGTAVTFDCINEHGEFIGGAILPGLSSFASILHQRTAKLPDVIPQPPDRFPALNTIESLQAGIWFGWIDAINGILERLSASMPHPRIVVTGGDADKLVRTLNRSLVYEPWLVFKGLLFIALRMNMVSDRILNVPKL